MWKFNKKKLIEALLFFARNTDPHKFAILKAIKLIYFSDLEHFRRYLRPIAGDHYYRHQYGPVPERAYGLLNDLVLALREKITTDPDFTQAIGIKLVKTAHGTQHRIVAKRDPKMSVFSDSDEEVMRGFVEIYKDISADDIKKSSYEWTKKNLGINLENLNLGASIDPKLILSQDERNFVEWREKEEGAFEKVLQPRLQRT